MRKIVVFLSILMLGFKVYARDWYVTTTGSGTTGTINSPVSIQYAFANAMPGDDVYIKAGNYGAIKLITSRAGTVDNPIQFIGYTNTPGDIVATNGPTYTKTQWAANGDRFPSDVMPLLDWFAPNDKPVGGDDAISVRHSYINIKNIMCQDYMIGFDARAANVNFDNVLAAHLGDWDPSGNCWNQASSVGCTNNNGYGIRYLNAPNGVLSNSLVIDAGIISVFIVSSDYVDILKTECWTVNPGNGTDYMFEYGDSDYGNIIDCFAKREHTLATSHTSRLIAIKCNSNFNTVTNFVGERSKIQVHDADNNVFKNISISGEFAEFQVIGGADNNRIENLDISNGYGISFLGWTGSECGVAPGSDIGAGSGNYFINIKIKDQVNTAQTAVVSFHRLATASTAFSGPNYIINLTADNYTWLLNKQRDGSVNFYNSSFSNSKQSIDVGTAAVTANFENCNFFGNNHSAPSGTNITTGNPLLNSNLAPQTGSALIDVGIDATTISTNADVDAAVIMDFLGNTRPFGSGWDIGAIEFGSSSGAPPTPPTEPTPQPNRIKALRRLTNMLING